LTGRKRCQFTDNETAQHENEIEKIIAHCGELAIRWLDRQLKGQKEEAAYFVGANCRLCKDARHTVEKKNID
jgi:hypothetical protein